MKKSVSLFLMSLFVCTNVFAASVEVRPEAIMRDYDEADQALGGGVNFDIKDLLPFKNVVLSPGFEVIQTEVKAFKESRDFDIISSKVAIGYDHVLNSAEGPVATVTPYVGLDFIFINGEEVSTQREVGRTIGVNLSKSFSENTSGFVGLGFQFYNTRIESERVDLSNFNWKAGLSIKF